VITGGAANWCTPMRAGVKCANPTGLNPKVADYRAFIRQYVPQLTAVGVSRFSIWNEPNLGSFLCAGTGVSEGSNIDASKCQGSSLKRQAVLYRKLYLGAWAEFKSLAKQGKIPKNVEVLIGELAGAHNGDQFMEMVLKAGKPLRTHGFANHPYQYCTDPSSTKFQFPSSCKRKMKGGVAWTKAFVAITKRWAKQKKLLTPRGKRAPLFLTEFGYHQTNSFAIPETLRAKWYPKAMDVARSGGAKQMTIYQVWASRVGHAWDTALHNQASQPLPSFFALKEWAKRNGYKTS